MQTEPFLAEHEWVNDVNIKPTTKDLKRAKDFLMKPGRKDAMFNAIQDPMKLFRRANAFAAAGFDIRNIVNEKIEASYWKTYRQQSIQQWKDDFSKIENRIRYKKLVMLLPEDLE